ncbi:MAG: redoxin domain-containing protein [bacterium]|nr:redoxin domain-containing protein [bacterium]
MKILPPQIPEQPPQGSGAKRFVLIGVVLALLAGAVWGVRNIQKEFLEEVLVEAPIGSGAAIPETPADKFPLQAAPDFTLQDQRGNVVRLRDLRGKSVVLLFFAGWNENSLDGLRILNGVFRKLHDAGIVVFAVDNLEPADTARIIASRMELEVPVLSDSDGIVGEAYRITVLPSFFFINTDGILEERRIGLYGADDLLARALQLK